LYNKRYQISTNQTSTMTESNVSGNLNCAQF